MKELLILNIFVLIKILHFKDDILDFDKPPSIILEK